MDWPFADAEVRPERGTRSCNARAVVVQDADDVGAGEHGAEFERELCRIGLFRQLALLSRATGLVQQ